MSDKFEFIDAECAAYQRSGEKYTPSIVKVHYEYLEQQFAA